MANPFESLENEVPSGLAQAGDKASGGGGNPFAPMMEDQYTAANPYAPRSWFTGANMASADQGWNTPFYQTWMKQEDEAAKAGTSAQFFDQDKATGIVTYEHAGTRQNENKTPTLYRFGDVYDGGKYQGNVYEQYDKATADTMMSKFMLDPDTQAHAMKSGSGNPDQVAANLGKEVDRRRAELERNNQGIATRNAYQSDVDKTTEDLQGGEKTAMILGSGAITAATLAPFGLAAGPAAPLVSGVLGLVGFGIGSATAFLNQDEIVDQAARGIAQQHIAQGENGLNDNGIFGQVESWSGLVQKLASPVSNLGHGVYDLAEGELGDAESEYYRRDAEGDVERPWWMRGVDLATGVTDAALQFASPVGKTIYTVSMTGTIAGKAGGMAVNQGQTFNERTGTYDNVFTDEEGDFNLKSSIGGIVDVGIDVVQLGMMHGLSRTAGDAAKRISPSTVGAEGTRSWRGGKSYLVNAEDRVIKDSSVRYTAAYLAPSEAILNSAGTWAARRAVRAENKAALARGEQGRVVDADDIYQAVGKLSYGGRRGTAAIVNGFGEGGEEFIQAVSEPLSHQAKVDWVAAGDAALQGFAMGVGMSLGTGWRAPTIAQKNYQNFLSINETLDQAPLSQTREAQLKSDWDKMNPTQQAAASNIDRQTAEIFKEALSNAAKSHAVVATSSTAMLETMNNNASIRKSRETGALHRNVDQALVVAGTSDALELNHGAYASAAQVEHMYMVKNKALQDILSAARGNKRVVISDTAPPKLVDANYTPEEQAKRIADLERQVNYTQQLMESAGRAERTLRKIFNKPEAEWDHEQIDKVLASHNRALQAAYDGERGNTEEEKLSWRKAASYALTRTPQDNAGSFHLLLPQIQKVLTETESNNGIQVSMAINQSLGMDFDGDKMLTMNLLEWTDQAFREVRGGMGFIGMVQRDKKDTRGVGVNTGERQWEEAEIFGLAGALNNGGALNQAAEEFLETVRLGFVKRYQTDNQVLTDEQIYDAMEMFRGEITSDNTNARGYLLSHVLVNYGKVTAFGVQNFSNEWLKMDQIIEVAMQQWQTTWGGLQLENAGFVDTSVVAEVVPPNTEVFNVRKQVAATPGMYLGWLLTGRSPGRQAQKLHYSAWLAKVIKHGKLNQSPDYLELVALMDRINAGTAEEAVAEALASDRVTKQVLEGLWSMSKEMARESNGKLTQFAAMAQIAMTAVPNYKPVMQEVDGKQVATGEMFVDGTTSAVQMMLEKALNDEQRAHKGSLTKEDELRIASQRAMLKPGAAGEALVHVVGNLTLYDMIGPSAGMIGKQITVWAAMQKYMGQSQEVRRISRENLQRAWEWDPDIRGNGPYEINDATGTIDVTPYQVLMSAIIATGDRQISMNEDGTTTGHLGDSGPGKEGPGTDGAIAGRSWQTIVSLVNSLELIKSGLLEYSRQMGIEHLTIENIDTLFQQNHPMAMEFLKLIPPDESNVVFEYKPLVKDGPNQLFVSPWVYEMLQMEPAQGAMHYLRSHIHAMIHARQASIKGEDPNAQVTWRDLEDRWEQLAYRLSLTDKYDHKLKLFLRDLDRATDIFEFMKVVNTTYKGNEAPYTAFTSEAHVFDVNRSSLLRKSGGTAADIRLAVRGLASRAEEMVLVIREAAARAKNEKALSTELLIEARRVEAGGKSSNTKLGDLQSAFKVSENTQEIVASEVMLGGLVSVQYGMSKKKYEKAATAPEIQPLGELSRHEGAGGQFTSEEHWTNRLTAVDTESVSQDMRMAGRQSLTLMNEFGEVIHWRKPTIVEFLEIWHDHPEAHAPLHAMFFPSKWTSTENGGLVQQSMTPPSLSEFLSMKNFFADIILETDQEHEMLYIEQLDANVKEEGEPHGMVIEINNFATAELSAANQAQTPGQLLVTNRRLMGELARIYKMIGSMRKTGAWSNGIEGGTQIHGLTRALELVRDEIIGKNRQRVLGLTDAEMADGADLAFIEGLRLQSAARMLELSAIEQQEFRAGTRDIKDVGIAERHHDEYVKMLEGIGTRNEAAAARDKFTFDWTADPNTIQDKKRAIIAYVEHHPELQYMTPWALRPLNRMQMQFGSQEWLLENIQMPADSDWDILGRACIASQISLHADPSSVAISLPEYPDPAKKALEKYFDPTWMYLVQDMLDPTSPHAKAAFRVHANSGITSLPTEPTVLAKLILKTVMNPERHKNWTDDIPVQSIDGRQRLAASSSSPAATDTYGNQIKREAAEYRASHPRYTLLGVDGITVDSLASKLIISGDELSDEANGEVDTTITTVQRVPVLDKAGNQAVDKDGKKQWGVPQYGEKAVKLPVVAINGRNIRSVKLKYGDVDIRPPYMDVDGKLQEWENLLGMQEYEIGIKFQGDQGIFDSHWQSTTVERLLGGALMALRLKSGDTDIDMSQLKLEIEYLHPDSQPLGEEWHNSHMFEGTVFDVPMKDQSLAAAITTGPGGTLARGYYKGIQAPKTGEPGFTIKEPPTLEEVQSLETGWQTDLANVIRKKARLQVTRDMGNGLLSTNTFNAWAKKQKGRHFVRWIDSTDPENPQVVFLSADEVINRQVNGEGMPAHAELVKVTPLVYNSMHGEIGEMGMLVSRQVETTNDIRSIPVWNGDTSVLTKRVPGLVRTEVLKKDRIENGVVVAREGETVFKQGDMFKSQPIAAKAVSTYRAKPAIPTRTRNAYEQGQDIQIRRQGEIQGMRKLSPDSEKWTNKQNVDNGRWLEQKVNQTVVGNAVVKAGFPIATRRGTANPKIASVVASTMTRTHLLDSWGLIWVFKATNSRGTSNGEYSRADLSQGKLNAMSLARGDTVAIDLASYEKLHPDYDVDQLLEEVMKDVAQMVAAGANIMIPAGLGKPALAHRVGVDLVKLHQYDPYLGWEGAFKPRDMSKELTQNQRGRMSANLEVRPISGNNVVVTLMGLNLNELGDGSAILADQEGYNQQAVPVDILPHAFMGEFGVPDDVADQNYIKRTITETWSADPGYFFGMMDVKPGSKEGRLLTQEMNKLIEWWNTNTGFLPEGGNFDFTAGSIIPWIGPNRAIILARAGYKPPGNKPRQDMQEEFLKQFAQFGNAADEKPRNIGIFTADREPDHSVHEGKVLKYERTGATGLAVHLLMPLQKYFDKIVHEGTGLKNLITTMPANIRIPAGEIFKGIKVALIGSWRDELDKEAYDGTLYDIGTAWAHMGVNNMKHLVKFFTGEDTVTDVNKTTVQEIMRAVSELPEMDPLLVLEYFKLTNPDAVLSELAADFPPEVALKFGLSGDHFSKMANRDGRSLTDHIAFATLLYMRTPNANLNYVISTPGIIDGDLRNTSAMSHYMPSLFTSYFNKLPRGSQARADLVAELSAKLGTGYHMDENLLIHIRTPQKKGQPKNRLTHAYLKFSQPFSTGANPRLSALVDDRKANQASSYHTNVSTAAMIGVSEAGSDWLPKTARFASGAGVVRNLDGGAIWKLWAGLGKEPPPNHVVSLNFAQRLYKRRAWKEIGLYREKIDRASWEEKQEGSVAKYEKDVNAIADILGLLPNQKGVIDHWVRQFLGKPGGEEGGINPDLGVKAVHQIFLNVNDGYLPTFGAEVPLMSVMDLSMLWHANRGTSKFKLRDRIGSDMDVTDWNAWVQVSLGVARANKNFDQMYLLAMDGMFHTYNNAGQAFGSLGVSFSDRRTLQLLDPATSEILMGMDPEAQKKYIAENPSATGMALSMDPGRIRELAETPLFEGRELILDDFDIVHPGAGPTRGRFLPHAVQTKIFNNKVAYREKIGSPQVVPKSLADFRKSGGDLAHENSGTSALLHAIVELRFANATLNFALYPSALLETLSRGVQEDLANLLSGDSFSVGGMMHAWLDTKTPEGMKDFAEKFGFSPRVTLNQIKSARSAAKHVASWPSFKDMIRADTNYELQKLENAGKVRKGIHFLAKFGGKLQDPTLGMRQDTLALRYINQVGLWILDNPKTNTMTIEYVIEKWRKNPEWIRINMTDAHKSAIATITNIRMLKPQVPSLFISSVIENLTKHPVAPVAITSTLFLKLPFMFHTFAINAGTNILGLQGVMALWAMHLDGKRNRYSLWWHRFNRKEYDEEKDGYYDMSSIIEAQTLSKAFIQSGVSMTALFAGGMMAGGLGLGGEDEEDRRRRRAIELQGGAYIYDPRKVENDFRNADAIFLDNLPFGTGWMLAALCGDQNQGRAMVQPYWTVKQFVSPLMGMQRFFDTGDPRQIVWGFKDALGSFPLINSASWHESLRVYEELSAQAADAESMGTVEGLSTAFKRWNNVVMTFERMLFENAMVNAIYVGADDYDRDPYIIPERTGEGEIWRDREGTPRAAKMLEDYVDKETGEVKSRYVKNDAGEASERAYTENRASYALFKFLSSGLKDDSYFRQNMVVKMREIQKPEMTQNYAEALVMSIVDPVHGGEVLTTAGAKAIYHGLRKQSITLDSPNLAGVYVPFEMRRQIQADWLNDITQDLVDKGFTESKAKYEANIILKGDYRHPEIPGLATILWDDRIPYTRDIRYKQLNTTYVTGPDGLPWATGVKRATWQAALGIQPAQSYYDGGQGSNLEVDSTLNSVDFVNKINTGLRALRRTDESWTIPTPEEIGKSIEDAIKENAGKAYTPSNWKDFGYGRKGYGYRRGGGYGGGGGGGGGGYPARLQAPPRNEAPYSRDVQGLRLGNPFVRRASIHRERFSSERGRLNQWQ